MDGIFNNFFGDYGDENNDDKKSKDRKTQDDGRLTLHKEELDINKDRISKGEVDLSKDVVEDHKTVDVPVTHEEVVIERKAVNDESSNAPISEEDETIRIPVSEDKVNVNKHTVVTGEISAHKHEVKDTEKVDEKLKREEAHIDSKGDVNVVDNSHEDSHGFQ